MDLRAGITASHQKTANATRQHSADRREPGDTRRYRARWRAVPSAGTAGLQWTIRDQVAADQYAAVPERSHARCTRWRRGGQPDSAGWREPHVRVPLFGNFAEWRNLEERAGGGRFNS